MKVLLSIKPKYAEKIFSGEKKWEYRKKIWTQKVDKVVVYASTPTQRVVGEFEIDQILSGSPIMLWRHTLYQADITVFEFATYFEKYFQSIGYAIEIKKPIRYEKPLTLKELGVSRPPQNFMYLED